jgi:hypothetical protein
LRLDERRERAKFKDSALAKGRRCADWNAAYRNWLRKSVEFAAMNGKPPGLALHEATRPAALDPAQRLRLANMFRALANDPDTTEERRAEARRKLAELEAKPS